MCEGSPSFWCQPDKWTLFHLKTKVSAHILVNTGMGCYSLTHTACSANWAVRRNSNKWHEMCAFWVGIIEALFSTLKKHIQEKAGKYLVGKQNSLELGPICIIASGLEEETVFLCWCFCFYILSVGPHLFWPVLSQKCSCFNFEMFGGGLVCSRGCSLKPKWNKRYHFS